MAQTLYKTGITTGQTVTAAHVTQSIDAFTGEEAYNISLSGSFNMTGSIISGGDLTVAGTSTFNGTSTLTGNTYLVNNLIRNCTITGSLLATGSISTVGDLTTVGLITGTNIHATSHLSSSGNLTIAGNSILGNAITDTTTVNGNITGTDNLTVASFVSGSTIIGNKNGIAICADATELVESKTRFIFATTKFIKGTRLYFISDGSIWNVTAYCLCNVADVSSS